MQGLILFLRLWLVVAWRSSKSRNDAPGRPEAEAAAEAVDAASLVESFTGEEVFTEGVSKVLCTRRLPYFRNRLCMEVKTHTDDLINFISGTDDDAEETLLRLGLFGLLKSREVSNPESSLVCWPTAEAITAAGKVLDSMEAIESDEDEEDADDLEVPELPSPALLAKEKVCRAGSNLGMLGCNACQTVAQDLCEIERELLKYQHLLGIPRVKVKVRDRRAWRPTTRAVREDTVAAPAGDPHGLKDVITQPHEADLQPRSSSYQLESTQSSSGHLEAKRGSRRLSKADGPGVERHHLSGSASEKTPAASPAPADERPAARRTSIRAQTRPATSKAPEVPEVPEPPQVPEVPEVPQVTDPPKVDPFLEKMTTLKPGNCVTHWAQVDTLFLSRQQPVPSDGKFLVRGMWLGKEKVVQTGTNKEVSPNDSTDFPLRCKVREQLKLEAAADVRVIVIHLIQLTAEGEKVLGSVMLDSMDQKNHSETVQEHLYDPNGQKLDSYLKVKLATATTPPPQHAVKQDPAADPTRGAPSVAAAAAVASATVVAASTPVDAQPDHIKKPVPATEEKEQADEEIEVLYEEEAEEEPGDDDPEED